MMGKMKEMIDGLNAKVTDSKMGKMFELEERKSNFTTEIKAGTATFLTMAYILAVNPRILSDSGGSCVAPRHGTLSPTRQSCPNRPPSAAPLPLPFAENTSGFGAEPQDAQNRARPRQPAIRHKPCPGYN